MGIHRSIIHEFQTLDDVSTVMGLIFHEFPYLSQYETAILELMINAIEHGNLEIGYAAKSILMENDKVEEEIRKRLKNNTYKNRSALIEIKEFHDEVVVLVCDEGGGFEWKDYLDKKLVDIKGMHGRGIPMSLAYCKTLTYIGNGSKVIAVFDKPSEPSP